MDKEKILLIVGLAFDIQSKGEGVNGFPYVSVNISNYCNEVGIFVQSDGFSSTTCVEHYSLTIDREVSEERFNECIRRLAELRERADKIGG